MSKTIKDLEHDLLKTRKACSDGSFLKEAAGFVRDAAKGRAPHGNTGQLWNSINYSVESTGGVSTAHIGTGLKYAPYVEFGTGPKGSANHNGIAPDVNPAYHTGPWYVPEDKLDPDAIKRYHWKKFVGKDGTVFYRMYGQAAQPFLYPALKDNEKTVLQIIQNGLKGVVVK